MPSCHLASVANKKYSQQVAPALYIAHLTVSCNLSGLHCTSESITQSLVLCYNLLLLRRLMERGTNESLKQNAFRLLACQDEDGSNCKAEAVFDFQIQSNRLHRLQIHRYRFFLVSFRFGVMLLYFSQLQGKLVNHCISSKGLGPQRYLIQ